MQIRLHRVRGSNALAYGDFDFVLDGHTVYQLIGKNGSGKSSLSVILEEVLYNKNSRGFAKSELANYNTDIKGWWGEVTLFLGDDKYVIHKEVKVTTKVMLFKNYEDISGHTATQTYKMIKTLLGEMEFKTFTKLVYQSMVSSMDFLSATDANRKKFLVSLLGLEHYSEIETKLKEAHKAAKSELDKIVGKVETIEKWLKLNSTIPNEIQLVDVPELDCGLETSLSEKQVLLRTIDLENKQILTNNKMVEDYGKRVEQFDLLQQNVGSLEDSLPAPVVDKTQEIQKVTCDLAGKQSEMDIQKNLYQKFRDAASKVNCPTCGSHLDVAQKVLARDVAKDAFIGMKPLRDMLRADLDKLQLAQEAYKVYNTHLAKVKQANQRCKDFSLGERHTEYQVEINSSALSLEVLGLRNRLGKLKSSIDSAKEHNTTAQINNAKRDEISKNLSIYKEDYKELIQEFNALQEEVSDIQELTKAFGSRGLISYKIESNVKVFENLINKYLTQFTAGRFALGFVLNESKLQVVIYNNSREVSMHSLSSGEQSKVNISTLLAIRNLMSIISKVELNLLFLDEVISVLDTESMDLLVEIMLKETNLNTFLVSHGYNHPLTNSVYIENIDGISRITNG